MSSTLPSPDERFCSRDGIELCYETFGRPEDPAFLLVMGLGTQMLGWNHDFCAGLAARGFFVIRYDNRDIGRSTQFRDVPPPTVGELLRRRPKRLAYGLEDMADDGMRVLDCLGIERAHVCGASMGGMIAQVMAGRHPDRVLSLVSIMSTTGHRWKGQPALRTYPVLLAKPPQGEEQAVERTVKAFRAIGSPGFERDEDELREVARLSWRRRGSAAGPGRQLAAILAAGDRTTDLARVQAPTLVVHGTKDRLVRPSGGIATAQAIRGARLLLVEGMGHDLPRGAWPQILDAMASNAARAGAGPGAAAGREASEAAA
jgi:pimeloyl-ACP methyl ester carboxylesterase